MKLLSRTHRVDAVFASVAQFSAVMMVSYSDGNSSIDPDDWIQNVTTHRLWDAFHYVCAPCVRCAVYDSMARHNILSVEE